MEEAREILEKVAKVNKKEMPRDELHVPVTMANKGVLELFKTWKLAKLSLIQCYAWSVTELWYKKYMYMANICKNMNYYIHLVIF